MLDLTSPEVYRAQVERAGWYPRAVVWELTLKCNLRCKHCGSTAGKSRNHEMCREETLSVADQLADLGSEIVTLSGGEPTLNPAWDEIASRLTSREVYVNMITNGVYGPGGAKEVAQRAKAAGMGNIGVSIDGPKEIHDDIRGNKTFARTMESVKTFIEEGMKVAALTTVSKLNIDHLEALRDLVRDAGIRIWRLQLALPMGVMGDENILAPSQIPSLMKELARLKKQGGLKVMVADTIGYYGPYDRALRGRSWGPKRTCWQGCQAGRHVLGIEASGNIKGCLSMQAYQGEGDSFVEGNLKEHSLEELWYRPGAFAYNRQIEVQDLTGECKECKYAALCRGGARCVSAATQDLLTEDLYCYTRQAQKEPKRRWEGIAASAAAALLLSFGGMGCDSDEEAAYGVPMDVMEDEDTQTQPAYGVPEDVQTAYGVPVDVEDDPGEQPAYGVPEDVVEDEASVDAAYGVPEDVQTAYGVPVDVEEDMGEQPAYGVPEDVVEDMETAYGVPVDVEEDSP